MNKEENKQKTEATTKEQPETEKKLEVSSPQGGTAQQSEQVRSKSESDSREDKVSSPQGGTHSVSEQVRSKSESDLKVKSKSESTKKAEAIANGKTFPISKKHSQYICTFIKNKSIDQAVEDLNKVTKFKRIIPFKGEIPHRKGKGVMSGRYPIKASKYFISLLKGLKGNVLANQMDLEKTRITFASASWASRPMRKGGTQGKRSNIILKATEVNK